jgi:hypothetical protein
MKKKLQEEALSKEPKAEKSSRFPGQFLFDEETLKSVLHATALKFLRDDFKTRPRAVSRGRSPPPAADDEVIDFDVDDRVTWSEHVIPRDDLIHAIESDDDYDKILRRLGCSDGTAEDAVNKLTMKCGARAHAKARKMGKRIPKDEEEKSIYLRKDLDMMKEVFQDILRINKIRGIEPIEDES